MRNFMPEVEKSRSQGIMTWADCCRFSSELFAAVASTSAPGLEKASKQGVGWLAPSFLLLGHQVEVSRISPQQN
jgi:hypothetical protein